MTSSRYVFKCALYLALRWWMIAEWCEWYRYCLCNSLRLWFLMQQSKPKTDTSALEARNGKDIQGIPWERMNYTRDKYREKRLKQYKNYECLSRSREELDKVRFLFRRNRSILSLSDRFWKCNYLNMLFICEVRRFTCVWFDSTCRIFTNLRSPRLFISSVFLLYMLFLIFPLS